MHPFATAWCDRRTRGSETGLDIRGSASGMAARKCHRVWLGGAEIPGSELAYIGSLSNAHPIGFQVLYADVQALGTSVRKAEFTGAGGLAHLPTRHFSARPLSIQSGLEIGTWPQFTVFQWAAVLIADDEPVNALGGTP